LSDFSSGLVEQRITNTMRPKEVLIILYNAQKQVYFPAKLLKGG